jgi:hypothetical protein
LFSPANEFCSPEEMPVALILPESELLPHLNQWKNGG